jgi:uncharacterized membrane protein YphA (DoxX/SURF4 family)
MDTTTDHVVTSVSRTLRWTFGLIPIAAGLDKFFNLLTQWPKYVSPAMAHLSPLSATHLMYVAGVVEIVAGLFILLSPWTRTFAFVVSAWLAVIALDLVAGGTTTSRCATSRWRSRRSATGGSALWSRRKV